MFKKIGFCSLTIILLLAACSPAPYNAESSAATVPGAHVFFATADGLYRANPDGSDQTPLKRGKGLSDIGSVDGWVYFTGEDDRLYRMDENGKQEQAVTRDAVDAAMVVKDTLWYIQGGKVLDTDGQPRLTLPQDILALPYNFKSDGQALYLCTYGEQGICSVYQCDTANGKLNLRAADVYDNPFVLCGDQAIQISDAGPDNQIFAQRFDTGEKQALVSYTGILYDMGVYGDWLLYITQPSEAGKYCMNGYNLRTRETIALEAPGDAIYRATADMVLVLNSQDRSLSRLTFDGGTPSFSGFSQGA